MDSGISDISARRARIAHRNSVLRKRGGLLPNRDRQLLAVSHAGQISQRHLAAAIGCHHATLYRRIRRLRACVTSPAAAALAQRGQHLPLLTYVVALRRHTLGHPISAIARDLAISRYRVLQALALFAGWLSAQRLSAKDPSLNTTTGVQP